MTNTITYRTPAGKYPGLAADILKQPHTLIAGATGSGKSVLINSVIYAGLYFAPCEKQFILIDPKRVELIDYKDTPHTLRYASEPADIAAALRYAVGLMENRYRIMQQKRIKQYTGAHIYIFVDEFADLMTTQKRETMPLLCRIAQLGRAAGIHLILATQRPTRDIITGQIKVNIDARIALRCPTAQDSRNIINVKGAELLPRYGYGYYLTPETMQPALMEIPYTDQAEIKRILTHWKQQQTPKQKKKFSLFHPA